MRLLQDASSASTTMPRARRQGRVPVPGRSLAQTSSTPPAATLPTSGCSAAVSTSRSATKTTSSVTSRSIRVCRQPTPIRLTPIFNADSPQPQYERSAERSSYLHLRTWSTSLSSPRSTIARSSPTPTGCGKRACALQHLMRWLDGQLPEPRRSRRHLAAGP